MTTKSIKVKRALISVSDKTGIVPFAKVLCKLGVEIVSTGGTLKALRSAGVKASSVSDATGFPEILDGRVKTLHPKIFGGILYLRASSSHKRELVKQGIAPIDMVVVNLYPFKDAIKERGITLGRALENIDIGGVALIRAAAKNFNSVVVVTDTADYEAIAGMFEKTKGNFSLEESRRLARKAFSLTSSYDYAIQDYLRGKEEGIFPPLIQVESRKIQDLRYGENPHQRAALYESLDAEGSWRKLHGKELSYNNLLDMDACLDILHEFRRPAACVVKHNNPCGIAEDKNLARALTYAIECDPLSGFGGIVGLNRPCDSETARVLLEKLAFFEVVIAPSFDKTALSLLESRKNLRVIEINCGHKNSALQYRFMQCNLLVEERDLPIYKREARLKKNLRCATKFKPSPQDIEKLLFAWRCAKHVRSNAIVLAQDFRTVGIGAGQMSRVDAVTVACLKAGQRSHGAYLASDGFFPMADNIEVAASNGIRAIIQPGGSIRDNEVIQTCNRRGIAMVFTGERHFKH
ncbi:MAG: bifunctional phosphoribosylaminoimidazolecarboxamide formyltransferase/IMP cyclohydrolase [Candidatus Omnitrophica bacterium]|nr:bifunctional phosphoribosylaminoimidazolecarboxamide formyltransferase/IMP cyclohydrolase [Candidatus Omnitrophota bacterium]